MKTYSRILLFIPVLLLTGCMVSSLNPIYTDKDLVFRPELIGNWQGDGAEEVLTFEQGSEPKTYRITLPSEGKTLTLSGHLTELNGKTYLDLTVADMPDSKLLPEVTFLTPIHLFFEIEVNGDTLRWRSMSSEWAKERREKHHLWISHQANDGSTLLTADTPRVQRFLRRWQNEKDAWSDWTETQRAPASLKK